MRIKKSEVAAAVVVVCAVVGVWAFGQVRAQVEKDQRHAFEKAHREQYSSDKIILLDSEEQEQCVDEHGLAYAADFGWEGRMEVEVEDAVLYTDLSDVPGLDPSRLTGGDGTHDSVVVVKVRLTNVDAEGVAAKEAGRDPYEFNASIFRLQGSSADNEVLLAGRGELEQTPGNSLHFVLPQGQSTVLEIAYGIPASDGARNAVLNIGSEGSGDDKISVDLYLTLAGGGDA